MPPPGAPGVSLLRPGGPPGVWDGVGCAFGGSGDGVSEGYGSGSGSGVGSGVGSGAVRCSRTFFEMPQTAFVPNRTTSATSTQ